MVKERSRWHSEWVDQKEEIDTEALPSGPSRPRTPPSRAPRDASRPRAPPSPGARSNYRNTQSPRRRRSRRHGRRASDFERLGLPRRLAEAGKIHLFSKLNDAEDKTIGYNIYLPTLQRMVLCQLRSELAGVVRDIHGDEGARKYLMDEAKTLLADYCNAVRDYDFMAERLQQAGDDEEDDPFQISTSKLLDLCSMYDANLVPMKDGPSWGILFSSAVDKEDYERRSNILPGASRHDRHNVMTRKLYLERLGMGLVGGLALIIPMVIMVLQKDLVTTLITTSVATMLFAGGLALLGTRLKGETVLASVAAYAAVLVVFVGTSE
ncbi:hypothetical protein QBC34DRAFT_24554 [Podospora aff. communis PSN243]|uniref:DUF6594 domain-containing protein n=1 Tax=Podospora aff. communis PSN243 TaxID=3040156 RepID=A0AAV9G5J3_9PEZI|nr:hypothetical protein QBC34DRAFT_24554 [Podospora aff. communis PSN243]